MTQEPRPKRPKSTQQINRKRLKALERRRDFLAARLDNYKGGSPSHDEGEKKALDWAIDICRKATGLEEPRKPTQKGEDEE